MHRLQHDQRGGISEPTHAARGVDAGNGIEAALDRAEHGREEGALALHHAGDVAAQWHRCEEHERQHERDLRPAYQRHFSLILKIFGTHERPDEVNQQSGGDQGAQRQVEHGLDPLAQRGIGRHEHDAAGSEDHDQNIKHRKFLGAADEIPK